MSRWIWAYGAGCLCAAPLFLVGGLLAFGAGDVLSGQDAGMITLTLLILLPFACLICMVLGAGPTLLTHFTLRGAGRADFLSYGLTGALLWGLTGLIIGALADPAAPLNGAPAPGDVHVLGWTATAALSGLTVLALVWGLAVRRTVHPHPVQDAEDGALQLSPSQIVHPPYQPYGQAPHPYHPQQPHHPQAPEPPAPHPAPPPTTHPNSHQGSTPGHMMAPVPHRSVPAVRPEPAKRNQPARSRSGRRGQQPVPYDPGVPFI